MFLPSFGLRLFLPLPTLLTYNPPLFFRATVPASVFSLVPHATLIFVFLAVGVMFCFPHASVPSSLLSLFLVSFWVTALSTRAISVTTPLHVGSVSHVMSRLMRLILSLYLLSLRPLILLSLPLIFSFSVYHLLSSRHCLHHHPLLRSHSSFVFITHLST